jgi:hypothetical protein
MEGSGQFHAPADYVPEKESRYQLNWGGDAEPVWSVLEEKYPTIIALFEHYSSSYFCLFKNNVSGNVLCLRPQVKAYSVGPNRQS